MDRPHVPQAHCGGCGAILYWCDVRHEWVDGRHRNSHDDDGRRIRHSATQERKTR